MYEVLSATLDDLESLLEIEDSCFNVDRLSRRSMRRFILSDQSVFLVAKNNQELIAYCLIIFHRGTRLARLYSIAVKELYRGEGVARKLITMGENEARSRGAFNLRLEVANSNVAAVALYQSLGFREFGLLQNYYEDHSDALRMQKRIRKHEFAAVHTAIPWYQQRTSFSCGPASLMMAMAGLDQEYKISLDDELEIWREATTIFMTSGHGGCHPLGLALAATNRGFVAKVWINQQIPLFVDGVRSEEKKQIIEVVHHTFVRQCHEAGIRVKYENIDQATLIDASKNGSVPVVLISTYRMDRKKAAHWVVISGFDDRCLYVHDPDPDEKHQDLLDCQYMPIALDDFDSMSLFGTSRLRTAVIISKR